MYGFNDKWGFFFFLVIITKKRAFSFHSLDVNADRVEKKITMTLYCIILIYCKNVRVLSILQKL